ncbi:MAG TPA: hypothetical protein VMI06_00410 [Terriglobia bacterium]|nr:hypothetical protein [Terriglobia bacterium]
MSLIDKKTTEAITAANRANALKSTGPATEKGKLQVRVNALKHGLRAEGQGPVISELRERDEDLKDLQFQLWSKFEPRGAYEAGLLEEIVQNRWRHRRVVHAESCLLIARQLQFDLDHERQLAGENRSASSAGEARQAKEVGLACVPDSAAKFSFILQCLRAARRSVEAEGFGEGGLKRLEAVYGPDPGLAGAALLTSYHESQKAAPATGSLSSAEDFQARRAEFLALLDVEISSFEKLQDLHRASGDELGAALRETMTILPSEDLDRITRYETVLDRQYDRLVRQLEKSQAEGRRKRARRDDESPTSCTAPAKTSKASNFNEQSR